MPSNYDDWNEPTQEWEPVVLKKSVPRFDHRFIEDVRTRRLALRLDHAAFGALVKVSATTMRQFEEGHLEFDTALQHRLRGVLMKPPPVAH